MRVVRTVANTAEIIAIMRHAAQRLEQEDAQRILPDSIGSFSQATACRARAASADMAMTYAAVVLRMVAAVMEDGTAEPADSANAPQPSAVDRG